MTTALLEAARETEAATAGPRAHGTNVRYVKGPDENDQPGGCRCRPCTDAATAARQARRELAARGEWQPYVDAGAAREHLLGLADCGMGCTVVSQLAEVPVGTLEALRSGETKRVRPETAAKILAVHPDPDAPESPDLVDATGTRRRLQALATRGYSWGVLAGRLGMELAGFHRLLIAGKVPARRASAARDLYEELWDVPPDESKADAAAVAARARRDADKAGWPPPAAWDDDGELDDPEASAAPGWKRSGRRDLAGVIEDATWLMERQGHTRNEAAARLGMKRDSLDTAMSRAAARARDEAARARQEVA